MRRFAIALVSAAAVMALSRTATSDDGKNDPLANIKSLAGNWDVSVLYWLSPDAKPGEAKGTETCAMAAGGTVLRQDSKYTIGAVAVEQMMVMGYNTATKMYFANSYSSSTPGFLTVEGTFDDKGETLTLVGSEKDPTGGADQKFRVVIEFSGADAYKASVFLEVDGKDFKAAEYSYTRRK
ncbi:MAG: DUF1579 domain-containing protein [Planctomycetes bacterium]|nr:DUF1579 domain-containing protein [Planctomycetota bacterium]